MAQQRNETIEFLNQFIKNFPVKDTFYYAERVDSFLISNMEKVFLKDTIWMYKQHSNISELQRIDSVVLTPEEKLEIKHQIIIQESKVWKELLLYNSKLADQLMIFGFDSVYKANRKYCVRFLLQEELPEVCNFKEVLSLSHPIFLRNNTICLFGYQQRYFARSGVGQVGIYKKQGKEWKFINWYSIW